MEGMQGEGVDLAKLLRSAWVFHGTLWQRQTPLRHGRMTERFETYDLILPRSTNWIGLTQGLS